MNDHNAVEKPRALPAAQPIVTDLLSGRLHGAEVVTATKRVGDLVGYWYDEDALRQMDSSQPLYTTQTWMPEDEATEGALAWGNTTLYAGKVGDEYFMTRGHWHRKRERGELVVCVTGRGALLLMNERRETRMETLAPGSTHYVPGHTAHRTINTGTDPLLFLCAWSADCGHDYEEILERGFSSLLLERDGTESFVPRLS